MKTPPKPKKAAARKPATPARRAKKVAAARPATPAKKAKKAKKASVAKAYARRADLGAPIDGFFARQPPHLRPILEALRELVEETVPDAIASIKWGMPFYTLGRTMMCALGGHRSHVNLILAGPPGTFADPDGLLEGAGKTGRHLKVVTLDDLPREAARGWLRTAAQVARSKA